MIMVCSWCGKDLPGEPDPDDTVLRISHGICAPCAEKLEADARASHTRINASVHTQGPKIQPKPENP